MAYRVVVTEEAKRHLRWFRADQQQVIVDAIAAQLTHQPGRPTRNRFPMRPELAGPEAAWELRLRQWRVFYDIQESPEQVVRIRVIGEKRGNRLYVEGREVVRYD
jgi:mRNA-degrading endonuclease RelE of RelBE toxin-antitoxin system